MPKSPRSSTSIFVPVKVDRDERPDVDAALPVRHQRDFSGQGGWPLTGFSHARRKPFFGGTYFPPEDRMGRPGFRRVLLAVADAYRNQRARSRGAAGVAPGEAVAKAEVSRARADN